MAIVGHMLGRNVKNALNSRYLWSESTKSNLNISWHNNYNGKIFMRQLSFVTGRCKCFCLLNVPSLSVSSNSFVWQPSSGVFNFSNNNAQRTGILTEKYVGKQCDESDVIKEKEPDQSEHEGPKQSWSAKKIFGVTLFTWAAIGVSLWTVGATYILFSSNGPPAKDIDGNEIADEFSHLHWIKAYSWRVRKFMQRTKQEIEEPSSEKLLPDPLKEPYYQPPYTVVIELVDVLVHPDWQWKTGWRFKKRPGVEYFLQACGYPNFELVVYTKEGGMTAFPVIDQLDQQGHINFRLFRDATRYEDGVHKKDISCLNRDPSKIILIDCDAAAVGLAPRNAILLKKWNGEDDDTTLLDLSTLLTVIGSGGVDDVRTILDSYHDTGGDLLEQFKQRQQAFLEFQEQKKMQSQQQTDSKLAKFGKYGSGFRR